MSNHKEDSLSIAQPHPEGNDIIQKTGLSITGLGLLILLVAMGGVTFGNSTLFLTISLVSILSGTIIYAARLYLTKPAGIKNNKVFTDSLSYRGALGWILAIFLTGFYVLIYFFPIYLGKGLDGAANSGLVALFDPLSMFFKGQQASEWFVYGTMYTLLILALGFKFIFKYRHIRYQLVRTIVVMVSQLFLAFLIPEILEGLNTEKAYFAKDLKNMWPLNYYFFDDWHVKNMVAGGNLGMFYLTWGIFLFLVLTPIITYFVGKRWYCSWVCGCGGLAETTGDAFRHLSSKKLFAWKIERWMIHSVLILVFIMTAASLYGYFAGTDNLFGLSIYRVFKQPYGFFIGAAFSGVIGVGFYPLLGSRVWCRFGCPLAAYMGIIQRFKSRFRITTNGGQCISCGNCSTYCEMGIDVRSYAQKGQNIVRASCVGCGVCSAVCPRGVLNLENLSNDDSSRTEAPEVILGRNS